MESLVNLIYSEDPNLLLANIVGLLAIVEFISGTFYLIGRIGR